MASKSPQSHAKRARELAVREKRELKQQKKAERAAMREAGIDPLADVDTELDGDLEVEEGEDADEADETEATEEGDDGEG